jgi:hypothetical protein
VAFTPKHFSNKQSPDTICDKQVQLLLATQEPFLPLLQTDGLVASIPKQFGTNVLHVEPLNSRSQVHELLLVQVPCPEHTDD